MMVRVMGRTLPAFTAYGDDAQGSRRWGASLVTSSAIYVGLAIAVAAVGGRNIARVAEKVVDVTFVEKIVTEPPPAPPPAAIPEVKPQAPAAMAPVVRPDQKIRRLDKPPPPKEMVAPREMPTAAPREADPSEDKGVAVYGDGGNGDPAGLEGGMAQGGTLGGQAGGAIALPEDAVPPMPVAANAIPSYPQEARAAGKTGTVVLKVIILADGTVARVEVLRGEEPFVSAAVGAVKKWKYTPAQYKGQAITVYRIIQIPFKLTA
jgi:protein TonB